MGGAGGGGGVGGAAGGAAAGGGWASRLDLPRVMATEGLGLARDCTFEITGKPSLAVRCAVISFVFLFRL